MAKIDRFDGPHRFLSNFWPGDRSSVEHAYQAAKTLVPAEQAAILAAPTPGAAKRLGRRVTLRPDWNAIRVDVMRRLVAEKFRDPALAQRLRETGDAELVEGNYWGDTFWGVCRGQGENWLGRILMEVRSTLK